MTPTLPIAAFEAGRELSDVLRERRWTDWSPFSYPFNLTQQPAASIPCGFTKSGLPVGLHIVGARYADALVAARGACVRDADAGQDAGRRAADALIASSPRRRGTQKGPCVLVLQS